MNLTLVLLLIGAGYVIYTILESYRSMVRELREMRLKCMAPTLSDPNADPVDTMKVQMVKALSKLKDMADK